MERVRVEIMYYTAACQCIERVCCVLPLDVALPYCIPNQRDITAHALDLIA